MSNKTSQEKIKAFVERWTGKGYEKGESQKYWLDLLSDVLGVETPSEIINFEEQVKLDHTSFIDAYIPTTHVLIEQKSINIDLKTATDNKGKHGKRLSPFGQAKQYANNLPYSKRPRWIVTCNFKSFLIYDMEQPQGKPFEILLENLPKEAHMLKFLVEDESTKQLKHEMEISMQAGEIVGRLYEAFLAQYQGDVTEADLHALNVLCVRLVFCLWAEDAGVFAKDQFAEYLQSFKPENMRIALIDLFRVLDTPLEKRSKFLEDKLKAFPYVNGMLFLQQGEDVPPITKQTADLLINHASRDFDWSDISPTIFGALFESTLNPETRRAGGMHYTSIENIHKVIDPLFLDVLKEEFDDIRIKPKNKIRTQKLRKFQDKLASLTFLDPACGSGNFLTESYISLRRLENRVIQEIISMERYVDFEEVNPIKVHIQQFYGIEINDFAVSVAKTALWIAEAQMMSETENIIKFNNDYLPLKSYNNITKNNALRVDWEDVAPKDKLDFIIGNPPFVGYSWQDKKQKADILSVYVDEKGKPYKIAGKIDYVAGWYFKASQFIQGTKIRCAFVSTNSICQGEQVAGVWKPLYDRFGIHIDFAYRTFRWDSESNSKAHVHCVIVGFSQHRNNKGRIIFDKDLVKKCIKINPYLIDGDNLFITARTKAISNVPQLLNGGKPTEGGFLILTEEEKREIIQKEPQAIQFIRPYMMGKDFIDRKPRYCLWLVKASPSLVRKCPSVVDRIYKVREYRSKSPKEATRKKAETPMLFDEVRECMTDYIAIPKVSSERRRYIPMDYLSKDIIPGDKLFMLPVTSVYYFGVLESNVHMAWMRAVCGRLKSDYSYSNTIVYNNFPWPSPTPEQQEKIEQTAQAILDARALYPDSSLADLYDPVLMPPELLKAHRENDKAVMQAYGFPIKDFTESNCVAELFKMYKAITEKE